MKKIKLTNNEIEQIKSQNISATLLERIVETADSAVICNVGDGVGYTQSLEIESVDIGWTDYLQIDWDTTEDYDRACRVAELEYQLEESRTDWTDEERAEMQTEINELIELGICPIDDDEYACDWDNPSSIEIR